MVNNKIKNLIVGSIMTLGVPTFAAADLYKEQVSSNMYLGNETGIVEKFSPNYFSGNSSLNLTKILEELDNFDSVELGFFYGPNDDRKEVKFSLDSFGELGLLLTTLYGLSQNNDFFSRLEGGEYMSHSRDRNQNKRDRFGRDKGDRYGNDRGNGRGWGHGKGNGGGYGNGHGNDNGNVVTPVPEPSSMLLLGAGLVGLFGLTRKKLNEEFNYTDNKINE